MVNFSLPSDQKFCPELFFSLSAYAMLICPRKNAETRTMKNIFINFTIIIKLYDF
jgi:hypothetical protein